MTITTDHLRAISRTVQSGSHVVVRGHIGDEVLVDGEIRTEDWAIETVLRREAGMEIVLLADLADGLRCADPAESDRANELLRTQSNLPARQVPVRGALEVAGAVRTLLGQAEVPLVVVFRDPGMLLNLNTEQGLHALTELRAAMDEAACHSAGGPAPPRNAMIFKGIPSGPAVDFLAAVPGTSEVTARLPDREERRAVLEVLRNRFFSDPNAGSGAVERGLDSLARATHSCSIRELEQIRRRSHALEIPVTRPETLFRGARGERGRTPIDRVGVDTIMEMLRSRIVGQPAAMDTVERILESGRVPSSNREPGVTDHRPLAALVLHGAPGVGKTELARVLAEALCGTREALVQIDCAEYRNEHDVARLLGSPPGFVGYETGGALHDALARPVAVILFDEVDRAESRLEELLLGVFDSGRLTDGRGRTASFRNAIVILTTNKSTEMLANKVGTSLLPTAEFLGKSADAIKEALQTPREAGGIGSGALYSRLNGALVGFDYLRQDALGQIVDRSCRNIAMNLADEMGITVEFDVEAFRTIVRDHLGPDGLWDGRRARNAIDESIELPTRCAIEAAGIATDAVVRISPDNGGGVVITEPGEPHAESLAVTGGAESRP